MATTKYEYKEPKDRSSFMVSMIQPEQKMKLETAPAPVEEIAPSQLLPPVGFNDQPEEAIIIRLLDPKTSFKALVRERRVNQASKRIVDSILNDRDLLIKKLNTIDVNELSELYRVTELKGRPPIPDLHQDYEVILKGIFHEKLNLY